MPRPDEIIVYTQKDCEGSTLLKEYLDKKGVKYTEKILTDDKPGAKNAVELMNLGYRATPVMDTYCGHTEDFNPKDTKNIDALLDQLRARVVIYTQPECGYSEQAKKFLDARGILYTERNVKDGKAMYELTKVLKIRATPVIVVGKKHVVGFNPAEIEELVCPCTHYKECNGNCTKMGD